jgi:hypothetical protein
MKIWACYITYNNADYLAASLTTIRHAVDKIIVVEGRYPEYPRFVDRTEVILFEFQCTYPDKLTVVDTDRMNQIDKRNKYIELVPDNDWMLILDGDHIPFGSLELLKGEIEKIDAKGITRISLMVEDGKDAKYHPMLIKKRAGMRYEGHHWNLMCDGYNAIHYPMGSEAKIDSSIIKIMHFRDYRHADVIRAKEIFYQKSDERAAEKESIKKYMFEEMVGMNSDKLTQLYELSSNAQNEQDRPDKKTLYYKEGDWE